MISKISTLERMPVQVLILVERIYFIKPHVWEIVA